MDFDHATLTEAFNGEDPRQWVSLGLVDADTPDSSSVIFKEDGAPLPFPIVMVTLEPRGLTLPCRVASNVAGAGEGSWYPFVAGDEVLVVIPQGDEAEGGIIIGRLNQSKDTFPTLVAGADTSENKFGFTRMQAPYVIETAAGYLVRSALTKSFIGIDATGNVTIANGNDNSMLHIGTDFLALQAGDNGAMVQVLQDKSQVFLQANGTQFLIDDQATSFLTTGSLSLSTAGVGAVAHAISAESVFVLLQALLTAMNTAWAAALAPLVTPAVGAPIGPAIAAALATGMLPTSIVAAITAAAALPATPYAAPLLATLTAPTDPTGTVPGVAKGALLI